MTQGIRYERHATHVLAAAELPMIALATMSRVRYVRIRGGSACQERNYHTLLPMAVPPRTARNMHPVARNPKRRSERLHTARQTGRTLRPLAFTTERWLLCHGR